MVCTDQPWEPIYSDLADDPDLGELVELFVSEMDGRVAAFQDAYQRSDLPLLRTLAHQLKGAAGSYGFCQLTPAAYALECAARDGLAAEEIERRLEALAELCRRTSAGVPGRLR